MRRDRAKGTGRRRREGRPLPLLTQGRPGQAVTEYSLVVFVVLGLGIVGGWNLIPAFIDSFQRYIDGFYIILNLPIP